MKESRDPAEILVCGQRGLQQRVKSKGHVQRSSKMYLATVVSASQLLSLGIGRYAWHGEPPCNILFVGLASSYHFQALSLHMFSGKGSGAEITKQGLIPGKAEVEMPRLVEKHA